LAAGEFRFGLIVHRRFDGRTGRSAAMHGHSLCREAAPNTGRGAPTGMTSNQKPFFECIP